MFTADRPLVEWKKTKKVPVAWVIKARQDDAFCHNLKVTLFGCKNKTNLWKCQGRCAGKEAKFLVSRPLLRINEWPPVLADPICIPVCGLPECSLKAKQMEEGMFTKTMKMAVWYPREMSMALECAQCYKRGSDTGPNRLLMCTQCKDTYYCDKDCQRKHWKTAHKAVCKKGPKTIPTKI
jgi:hypothetical protein